MFLNPWLSTYTAVVIAAIILLNMLGWPRLRLRTYNKVHGGVRVIEIALVLSHARPAGPRALQPVFAAGRLAQRALQVAFRRPALGAAVPGTMRKDMHERVVMQAKPVVQDAAPTAIDSAAEACAECVVYVTLKW